MVGVGPGVSVPAASICCLCSIMFVSCILCFLQKWKLGEPAGTELRQSSRVVVPLPAARRPISAEVFTCGYGQLYGHGVLAALANPLVIGSREMFSKACRQRFGTMKKSSCSGRSSADIADHLH
jgi:hypothetical protein